MRKIRLSGMQVHAQLLHFAHRNPKRKDHVAKRELVAIKSSCPSSFCLPSGTWIRQDDEGQDD
ncbi:MAG: hypothetical protein KDA99_27760, partial [Planctomycetales bacterium]|nr:hypothetical protein [Planctomycetales bacterium]